MGSVDTAVDFVLVFGAIAFALVLAWLFRLQAEVDDLRRALNHHEHTFYIVTPFPPEAAPPDVPPLAQPVDDSPDDADFWKHGRPNPLDSREVD